MSNLDGQGDLFVPPVKQLKVVPLYLQLQNQNLHNQKPGCSPIQASQQTQGRFAGDIANEKKYVVFCFPLL